MQLSIFSTILLVALPQLSHNQAYGSRTTSAPQGVVNRNLSNISTRLNNPILSNYLLRKTSSMWAAPLFHHAPLPGVQGTSTLKQVRPTMCTNSTPTSGQPKAGVQGFTSNFHFPLKASFSSAARLSHWDPSLCVPALLRVCSCRENEMHIIYNPKIHGQDLLFNCSSFAPCRDSKFAKKTTEVPTLHRRIPEKVGKAVLQGVVARLKNWGRFSP